MPKERPQAGPLFGRQRVEGFRRAIELAEADGLARTDMVLHLTHRDVHGLKRDREIPVADISFADGVMHFIGVRVIQGDSAVSFLGAEGRESVNFAG